MALTEQIYARSPIWMQHLLVSAQGHRYRYGRSGDRAIRVHLDPLLKSQWWTKDQFAEFQIQSLRRLLCSAFGQVPYYRRLQQQKKLQPEVIQTLEDLRQLPILEKSTLRGNEQDFLNPSYNKTKCSHLFTSGTTGSPINIYETRKSFSRRWAFVSRLRTWAGVAESIYPRRAQFTGRDIVPRNQRSSKHVYWRNNFPGNTLLLSTSHLNPETVPYYARMLSEFKPVLMDGYPSAILIIARVASSLSLDLPRPKAIIVSAETLFPEDRKVLEQAFGCRVFNQYAATEPSCFWCDCEYGVMHVNPDYGISEIVDSSGNPVPPGGEGEVVVTSFLNEAMPLIRYRLGDMAVAGPEEPCACGRKMPRIERVLGRVDDILYVPPRGYVGRLDPAFKGLSHIVEAQIVQDSLDRIKVLIVPEEGYTLEVERKLISNLRAKVGDVASIKIEQVSRIPRGENGKFRAVISDVKHLYPHQIDLGGCAEKNG